MRIVIMDYDLIDYNNTKDLAVKIIKGGCCDSKVFVIHLPTGLMAYGYDVKNACDIINRQIKSRKMILDK
jgi:CO dehydrogenase/acetyl-CoA synthase delta subunit